MAHNGTTDFVVVGLGASSGGLEALEQFFARMPADCGFAFVVVQHLSPHHLSALTELLGRHTTMSVQQATDHTLLIPNHVYVIPPNAVLTLEKQMVRVTPPSQPRGKRMPIDSFFTSLAESLGENAVCIMLSGTGTDGTLGLRAVKEHGGIAMAQTLETAKYDAILRSAIATGLVDYVLRVEDMPAKLLEYASYLRMVSGKSDSIPEQIGRHVETVHRLLRRHSGHDFSQYKEATINRRLERRMKALQIETVEQYVELLDGRPGEADQLFKDLLVGVTQFFRDPKTFDVVARLVVPRLFEGKDASAQARVCVVGCSSGEEAYSLAILLAEHAATLSNPPTLKVFATDIDDRGLEVARQGFYPLSIAQHVSPERLERFFIKEKGAYRIKRELREICIFSAHSFIKDPPFSRLDLISCRNVLIYLGPELQRKLIPLFHYALRPGGYLLLGPSESADGHKDLFHAIDKRHRVFRKKESVSPAKLVFTPSNRLSEVGHKIQGSLEEHDLPRQLERLILRAYGLVCVIVKESGEAVYFSGQTARYLQQPVGLPDNNVLSMACDALRFPLRSALHRAISTQERVVQRHEWVSVSGTTCAVDLAVEPLTTFKRTALYLIVFEEVPPELSAIDPPSMNASDEQVVQDLEWELQEARDLAQTAYEDLETSHKELQSANEEYQTTNEELETSKEELQSFNEELETVNAELNRKVAELDIANSDLQNLLNSTQLATLFLDAELRIKKFTPAAASVFHLLSGDIGRPLTDLAHVFTGQSLTEDITMVLKTLDPVERELSSLDQRRYLMRILPYRTVHNLTEGIVITFTDVTHQYHAQKVVEEAKLYAEHIVETIREPLVVLDPTFRVQSANKAFYNRFTLSPEATVDQSFFEVDNGRWDVPQLHQLMVILPNQHSVENLEVHWDTQPHGLATMLVNARQIEHSQLILLVIEDITERKQAEEAATLLAAILQRSADEKSVLLREIHHRVKNNLQIIVSLFSVQADYYDDPRLVAALAETESRVRAIAHLHEQLYASDDLAEVDFGKYLMQIARELLAIHTASPDGILLDLQVTDMVLEIEQAIPLGLIANELILNSLKHGFKHGDGRLVITLSYDMASMSADTDCSLDDAWIRLEVRDSGPGFPPGLNILEAVSMGLHLVNLLVKQLAGRLEVMNPVGAHVAISFPQSSMRGKENR